MQIRRCMKCMHELRAEETVCPNCGRVYGQTNTELFALKPGTILEGKYLVGEMLGQGGFGITYIGFDLLLEQKVAIKEYYPMSTGMVSRDSGSTVVWSNTMLAKTGTERGFDSFLKEARKMAKLGSVPGVVGVKSVFIENGTAYIVMDYVEGETLLTKLQRESSMDFSTAVSLLAPVMKALDQVHAYGIIHRDISPDNIMVKKDGTLVLLDLGAAKDLEIKDQNGNTQHSSQLVAKHGFSPAEQYSQNTAITPAADVYAMAATVYYCCTKCVPPPAIERLMNDTFQCQPRLKPAEFQVLAKGMALRSQDRIQTVGGLLQALGGIPNPDEEERRRKEEERRREEEERRRKDDEERRRREAEEYRRQEEESRKAAQEKAAEEETRQKLDMELDAARRAAAGKQKKKIIAAAIAAILAVVAIGIGVLGKKNDSASSETQISLPAATKPATETTEAPKNLQRYTMKQMEDHDLTVSDLSEKTAFWGQTKCRRENVKTVTFKSTRSDVPQNAWDVSEAEDGSIMAWMQDGNLTVAADGIICLPQKAQDLFSHFKNVKSIHFGDSVDTSNVTDMDSMFYSCESLTSLDLSGFDTSQVTDMGDMFCFCKSLTSLDLSGFDTSNVTDMVGMFGYCESLTTLDLSGFDTSKVTNMSLMFYICESLTSLDLSGFDTSKVMYMARMFGGCSSLTSLDLSGFDTSNVTHMSWMFDGCSSLTSLDLSGFDTSKVTDMSWMFYDCSALSTVKCADRKIQKAFKNR